jgi:Ca2+-binding EF-hand superfamily protein
MISCAERARRLFAVLDQDGDGVLTMEEFIEGTYMEVQNIRY